MADTTSHRATVISPARDTCRGPNVGPEASTSPAPPVEARANHGSAAAGTRPTGPAAGANGTAVEVAERYLAPALRAAAAARARTAHIRATASAATAGRARPDPQEWLVAPPADSAATPSAQSPAALRLPPIPIEDPKLAEMAAAWTMSALSAAGGAGPARLSGSPPSPTAAASPAAPAGRGLSVAEVANASRIAFRPLRRPPPARSAPPANPPRPPAALSIPTPARQPVAPAKAAASPTVPTKTLAPTAPAKPVTRPGVARLVPGEAVQCAVPERPTRQQRFAKTIAELQRYQAAARPSEPWGNVVPRPAVPQSNPATSDSRWSRLWSRR